LLGAANKELVLALQSQGNLASMRLATDDFTWWHPLISDIRRKDMAAFDRLIAQMFSVPTWLTVHNITG